MSNTLCLDFGNTRLKAAVFVGDQLGEITVLEEDGKKAIAGLVQTHHPDKSILSSVIDHNPEIESYLEKHTRFHKLGHQTPLPITTPVGRPETIGADRLALSVAAAALFPASNNLVIGLGSAITFNFINKYRQFLGGSISPGMEMRFRALHAFTAKLPQVAVDWNFPLIGYDTKTNILSGVILGMAKEIDGMIEAYAARYNNFNVLLSGGDVWHLSRHLKKKIFADPDLIFRGLFEISQYAMEGMTGAGPSEPGT